jgi:hypothetical protein
MEGVEWVVREGVGAGGEMTQALYAHMNNKTIKQNKTTTAKENVVKLHNGVYSAIKKN